MAASVFGTPITDETLKGLPKYHDKNTITQKDRAEVALLLKNAENKDITALKYLQNVIDRSPAVGSGNYTMGLIYNATGDSMVIVINRTWEGALQGTPYPLIIANGQWGAFLHGTWVGANRESKGGVVYAGKDGNGGDCHYLVAWHNHQGANKIFVEAANSGHYDSDGTWDTVNNLLSNSGLIDKDDKRKCYLLGSIANSVAINPLEVIITLAD